MLIHRIDAESDLAPLNASSKLNAEWAFLSHLHDIGRRTATEWLDKNYDRVGEESSVDIRSMFM
jgi:NTE family protein